MSKIRRYSNRAVAGGTAALLAMSVAVAGATPAAAAQAFEFHRISGPDRYATAAAIARATFTTSSTVLLANGQSDDKSTARNESHFPDALAANYLAGARSAPTLLTRETTLPTATTQALRDLQATTVIIIGGENAVSASQAQQLRDAGYSVQRIGGDTRYDTAAAVAATPAVSYVGLVDGRKTAIVASGVNFPDALVAGPLAYASKLPITITDPQRLSPQTSGVLRNLGIEAVLIPGGTTAVSESVANEIRGLGIAVQRFNGTNRSDTAALVAEYAITKLGFTGEHVNLALGTEFADALVGGPHAGRDRAPILLTASQDAIGPQTRTFLETHAVTLISGHIMGGAAAVSAAAESDAEEAAQGDAPPPLPKSSTVTVTNTTVQAGQAITGRVSGDNIAGVTVSGCGLTNEPVTDTNAGTEDVEFSETIPSSQAAGTCALTFTTTFDDGSTQTQDVEVTVTRSASTVILDRTSIEAGQPLTGRVEGQDIRTVTLTGCGVVAVPVEDLNTSTETIEFSEVIPQDSGTCTLTFTTTFEDATTTTQSFVINVIQVVTGVTTLTARPELVSAVVVGKPETVDAGLPDDTTVKETKVRFTFDEPVTGKAPAAHLFHLVSFDGKTRYDGRKAVVDSALDAVLVTFGGPATADPARTAVSVGEEQLGDVSAALVDENAVLDNDASGPLGNPAQDAALDTSAFRVVAHTNAPDLVSVGNFGVIPAITGSDTATAVIFVFDEDAAIMNPRGFKLVLRDGATKVDCTPTPSQTSDRITTSCKGQLVESQVARGLVLADTVASDNGTGNPLQVADVRNSETPDLVSGRFLPTVDRQSSDNLEVLFVFDEKVIIQDPKKFKIYKTDGSEITSISARLLTDPGHVVVTFRGEDPLAADPGPAPDPLLNSVGVSVANGAVVQPGGGSLNLEDEVRVDNPEARILVPGRTDNPDLASVQIGTSDTGGRTGVYTFDEAVALSNVAKFFLYMADGRKLTCTAATASGDTVTCTHYRKSLTSMATSADIAESVVGTLDDGAVAEASTSSSSAGLNPEGAAPATGGTGKPSS